LDEQPAILLGAEGVQDFILGDGEFTGRLGGVVVLCLDNNRVFYLWAWVVRVDEGGGDAARTGST
jgi:hypothetical protein